MAARGSAARSGGDLPVTRAFIIACFALVGSLAPAAALASERDIAEARRQFEAGVTLLQDPEGARYEEAYRAFRRSYELSRSPKVLGNIAFCAFHLERDGEAFDLYTAYLREVADVDGEERAQIQRDLATLAATLATVRFAVAGAPPGPAVLVDRRLQNRSAPVENTYPVEGAESTLRIRPGRHVFFVRAGDRESVRVETNVDPSTSTRQVLEFRALAAPSAPRRSVAGPLVLGGIGVVAIAGGVVSGIVAVNETKEIEDNCPNEVCPRTFALRSARTEVKTYGTIADVAFVSGGALVGVAALWYFLSAKTPSNRGALEPRAACTGAGCSLSLGGAF